MIFHTVETISPTIQNTIVFTFTLLQIYLDYFDIDEKENKT